MEASLEGRSQQSASKTSSLGSGETDTILENEERKAAKTSFHRLCRTMDISYREAPLQRASAHTSDSTVKMTKDRNVNDFVVDHLRLQILLGDFRQDFRAELLNLLFGQIATDNFLDRHHIFIFISEIIVTT